MVLRIGRAALVGLVLYSTSVGAQERPNIAFTEPQKPSADSDPTSGLSDKEKAALAAAIVAASVAAYLALGKPCACPYSTARNGSSCGARSAYSKPNGYKPVCYPTDVTIEMIRGWLKSKAVPL